MSTPVFLSFDRKRWKKWVDIALPSQTVTVFLKKLFLNTKYLETKYTPVNTEKSLHLIALNFEFTFQKCFSVT